MSQLLKHSLRHLFVSNTLKLTSSSTAKVNSPALIPHRSIARWVAPTLKELRVRKRKYGIPKEWTQRSTFIEWNFRAELFGFAKRLNEVFDEALLQQAFTHRSYIVKEEMRQRDVGIEPDINMKDNSSLVVKGEEVLRQYVDAFLRVHLPNFPDAGIKAVQDYLLSEKTLAKVSSQLGTTDIILSATYPPEPEIYANTLKAIVGARAESSSKGDISSSDAAYNFVRDFVCTRLNQKDLNEIWPTEEPYKILQEICAKHNIKTLEPRLIGEAGRNTILSTYHVGIFDGETKKLLGSGFGESVDIGVDLAARNALAKLFGTLNLRPINFQISVEEVFSAKNIKKLRASGQPN